LGRTEAGSELGMRTRREVLGDDHVDAVIRNTTELDAPFQDYITQAAWADVWGRPGLERGTRSLITIALLAALGHERELEMHLRASRRTGATPERIAEVPAANTAFAAVKRVLGGDVDQDGEGAS
jgi:4-carboxymuconolactone decarboxylase